MDNGKFQFINKTILIVSPQPWSYLFISKHNYAIELAKRNEVYYISAPEKSLGLSSSVEISENVRVIRYRIPVPLRLLFYWGAFYRLVNRWRVAALIKKRNIRPDVCIDFGTYRLYENLDFIPASTRIFFPVDDFSDLKISDRGASHIFSVSKNILEKLNGGGVKAHFINHGLSGYFAIPAKEKLANFVSWKKGDKIKVGYSGNLFIPFLNVELFKRVIAENPEVEFHLFGSTSFDAVNPRHVEWNDFLRNSSNVKLWGHQHPAELADNLGRLDAFILCYKPDFRNYHGENSHKIFEYLSGGRVIISTHISLYRDSDLLVMTKNGEDESLPRIFKDVIGNIERYNSDEAARKRISAALNNTYQCQLSRIEEIISQNES